MLHLTINGIKTKTREGASILDAARQAGVRIPTLCHYRDFTSTGACRMCLVEVEGRKKPVASCSAKAEEGMVVLTETPELAAFRKRNLELICSYHRQDCDRCVRFPHCELHALCREYGIDDRINQFSREEEKETYLGFLEKDHSKCLACRRCVTACRREQGIGAISVVGRGRETKVVFADPAHSACTACGQCILACPVGALSVKSDHSALGVALAQRRRYIVALMTDAFPGQLGEYFGVRGTDGRKAAGILRRMGFRAVYRFESFREEALGALCSSADAGKGETVTFSMCPGFSGADAQLFEEVIRRASAACRAAFAKEKKVPEEEVAVAFVSTCTAAKRWQMENGIPDYAVTTQEIYSLFEADCVSSFSARTVFLSAPGEELDVADGEREEVLPISRAGGTERVLELCVCPGGCKNGGGRARRGDLCTGSTPRSGLIPYAAVHPVLSDGT